MEKLKSTEIKIGILSEIRTRIVEKHKNITYTYGNQKDLRGILFTEQRKNIGNDIIYLPNEYPVSKQLPIYTPTIEITRHASLGPLLEYYGLTEFSHEDLQKFINEVILNKKWLKECHQLFGYKKKQFGPLIINYRTQETKEVIPEDIGEIISEVHQNNGFCLSKKEQKQYRPR